MLGSLLLEFPNELQLLLDLTLLVLFQLLILLINFLAFLEHGPHVLVKVRGGLL